MYGAKEEVERQPDVCQVGEIGEPLTVIDGFVVGVVVAEDCEDGTEGVEGEEGADQGEEEGRKEPGGGVGVEGVERGGYAEEGVEFGHFQGGAEELGGLSKLCGVW